MKRLKSALCLLLACCFVVGLLPMTVLAENTPESLSEEKTEYSVWNGSIASRYDGGSGTEDDPYQIANGEQLAFLAKQTKEEEYATRDKYYVLTNDIYLNEGSPSEWGFSGADNDSDSGGGIRSLAAPPANEWEPIGAKTDQDHWGIYKHFFNGHFNGSGHTIAGIYYNNSVPPTGGLFGFVEDAEIQNLRVKDSYIAGADGVGGICGNASKVVNDN